MSADLTVQPIDGEVSRFFVQSESSDVRHIVDVGEQGGMGECSCKHYEIRIGPKWKRNKKVPACKHLRSVYAHVYFEHMAKKNRLTTPEPIV